MRQRSPRQFHFALGLRQRKPLEENPNGACRCSRGRLARAQPRNKCAATPLVLAVSDDPFASILRRSDEASKRDAFAAGTSASRFYWNGPGKMLHVFTNFAFPPHRTLLVRFLKLSKGKIHRFPDCL